MKKILLIMLLGVCAHSGLLAQLSIGAFIAPRIEKEITKEVQMAISHSTKVNTYATINGNFQKNQFFVEVGLGFQQKYNQTIVRQGTVHYSGGSGEASSSDFLHEYNFNYTNLQSKINAGYMLNKDRLSLALGLGFQTEFLLAITDRDSRLLEDPKHSYYMKINPRIAVNDHLFVEFNNLFGFSKNAKPHVEKILYTIHPGLTYFYETGIGIGYTF
jgi:hypothetical protein